MIVHRHCDAVQVVAAEGRTDDCCDGQVHFLVDLMDYGGNLVAYQGANQAAGYISIRLLADLNSLMVVQSCPTVTAGHCHILGQTDCCFGELVDTKMAVATVLHYLADHGHFLVEIDCHRF